MPHEAHAPILARRESIPKGSRRRIPSTWDDPQQWQLVPVRAHFLLCEWCQIEYPAELRLEAAPEAPWLRGPGAAHRRYCSMRCGKLAAKRRYRWGGETPPDRTDYDALKLRAKRLRDRLAAEKADA